MPDPSDLELKLTDSEIEEIRKIAERMHLTVEEWIQRTLLEALHAHPHSPSAKLRAVQAAVKHGYPTGDIDQILRECLEDSAP